nr:neural Wiskott-Aldrich syndrome protein-like [Pogona vitticeps]
MSQPTSRYGVQSNGNSPGEGRGRREGTGNAPQAASVPSGPALPPRPAVAAVSPPPQFQGARRAFGVSVSLLSLCPSWRRPDRGRGLAQPPPPPPARLPFLFPSLPPPPPPPLAPCPGAEIQPARGRWQEARREEGPAGSPTAAAKAPGRPARGAPPALEGFHHPPGGRAKGGREAPLGSDAGPRPGRGGRGDAERGALIGAAREEPRKEGRKEGSRGKETFLQRGGERKRSRQEDSIEDDAEKSRS